MRGMRDVVVFYSETKGVVIKKNSIIVHRIDGVINIFKVKVTVDKHYIPTVEIVEVVEE